MQAVESFEPPMKLNCRRYVATPLVVSLLSASYILPPASSPASFVLVFLLIFFLTFVPLITVFNSDSPLSLCPLLLSAFYCAYEGSFFSNCFQYFFICFMFKKPGSNVLRQGNMKTDCIGQCDSTPIFPMLIMVLTIINLYCTF